MFVLSPVVIFLDESIVDAISVSIVDVEPLYRNLIRSYDPSVVVMLMEPSVMVSAPVDIFHEFLPAVS